MRSCLIFLTLVGFVACSTPWQANQQYKYSFAANTLTGYGLGQDQYVGLFTRGKLILQPQSESVVRGKLSEVRHAHFHDKLREGLNSQIPEEELKFSSQPSSDKLFSINYKNGVIRSLDVDQSLSNDDVNQLKAVLSQLQVDTTGENVIKCRHNQLPGEKPDSTNALYKTMEATVSGECETLYEMSRVPSFIETKHLDRWAPQTELELDENLFQFVKTVNYSNCDVRRGYHFGISGASDMKPNSNQMGDFLSKTAVTRVVVAGPLERFTIKSSETTNRVAVSTLLYDDEEAEVVSRIGIELESIEAAQSPLPIQHESLIHVGNLVYRYNIPSDEKNQPRTSAKSANGASSSSSSEEDTQSKRHTRSADPVENYINKHNADRLSSSSSSSSSESSEEYNNARYSAKYPHHYQPQRDIKEASEEPLLPFTVGNKGRSIQYHNEIDAIAEARKLANEIATDLQEQDEIPSRNTLEKYTILSELIQTMDYKQIEQIMEKQTGREASEKWGEQLVYDTLLDACAQSGTNAAVSWIVKAVSDGRLHGSEAASLLETVFENLRTPTEVIIREIFENIIKNEQVRKQNDQYPKILITFTDLLRRAYSNKDSATNYYPVQAFGSFEKGLGDIVTKEIIPYLGTRLAEKIKNKEYQHSQKYIRALGNTAHPKFVDVFEPYLEDKNRATPFERLAMVAAFDKIVDSYPKYAQKILYKIYTNVAEHPEIRSVAVTLIMRADPPAAMLQRMAMSTYNDPSIAVRTTVKSAINSAARLSSDHTNLAKNARAAQKFLNPHTFGLQNSKTTLRDHVSDILQLSEDYQMSHIIGPDSTFPKIMSYTSWKKLGGIDNNDIDVQALVSSVQDVWKALVSGRKSGAAEAQKSKYSVNQIVKQLGITLGSEYSEKPVGQLLFKLLGRKNFFSFDEKSLNFAPKNIAKLIQEFSSGRHLQYNKIYDHEQIIVAFPLATGYPFYYAYRTPILMQAVGEIKAKTTPSLTNAQTWTDVLQTRAVNVTTKVQLTFSMERIGKAGFITPFENQRYVAGQIQKMQVHFPISLNLNIDLENSAISGKMAPLADHDMVKLVHFSSWPFTARKNALSLRPVAEAKEVKLVEIRPSVGEEETFGEDTIGMTFHYKMQHQFPQNAVNAMEGMLRREGVKQYAQLPMNLILTMQKLVGQRSTMSPAQFLPFAFTPAHEASPTGNVLLSLLTMPFYQTPGLTKLRAALSLASMPFVDASELKQTTLEEDISANGPWPKSSVAQHKFTLSLDPKRSANQAVLFGIQFDSEKDINNADYAKHSDKPLSATDESKLANVFDIAPNSQPRREEMMANAGRDMKQAAGGLIDSAIWFDGSKPAKFVCTIVQADNSVGDKTRMLIFASAKVASGGLSKQIYASYIHNFANTPAMNYEQAEQHNGKSNAKLTVLFGEGGKPKNTKINVKAVLEQSENFKQQLRQTPYAQDCVRQMREEGNNQMPACLKATYQANLLDKIRVVIETEQLTPEIENAGHDALSLLNYWGYYNAAHNHNEKGQPGKFEASINVDPIQHFMNITLQLPSGKQTLTGLPIPRSARYLLSVHPGMDLSERMMRTYTRNSEVCVIDRSKILTFDNAIAKQQKLGQCWYAVVEHKSSEISGEDLSVLVRQSKESTDKKEVLIVASGQHIHISPAQASNTPAIVTVNDKPQQVSDRTAIDVYVKSLQPNNKNNKEQILVARIYAISENNLKVELPASLMKLYYDGERIRMHADPLLRNEVAGLCGNYNGEEIDDIATPQKKVLQNPKHYSPIWAVPDESCASEVQEAQQRAQAARSYEVKYEAGNVVSNFESGKKLFGRSRNDKKWESSESSSSSESNENERKPGLRKSIKNLSRGESCEMGQRVQFVTQADQYCFTKEEVNACPKNCVKGDLTEIEVAAHCRDMKDAVATMYVQQIRRGSNPDLASKPVNRNVRITVPRTCEAQQ